MVKIKNENTTVLPGECSEAGADDEKHNKSVSEQIMAELKRRDLLLSQLALCQDETENGKDLSEDYNTTSSPLYSVRL